MDYFYTLVNNLFLTSILFCTWSLKIREYHTLKPKRALKFFEKQDNIETFKRGLFDDLAENELFNTKQLNMSAGLLQFGIYSFVVAVILLAISFFVHVFS